MTYGYALLDASTNRILSIRIPVGQIPTNGLTDDGLYRNVIINDANLPNDDCKNFDHFIMNYAYNESTGEFDFVGEPPNKYATYSPSLGRWTWSDDEVMIDVRARRNELLTGCDWALVDDSPLTDAQKTEVRTYRAALRNFPSTITTVPGNIYDLSWPTKPSCLG